MSEQEFESVLDHLRRTRGFDFTAYKRSSLRRRLDKRMQGIGISDYEAYLDHLQVHPEEFAALFNTILINVTSFFRDPQVWESVATEVIPALLAGKGPDDGIRLWSAGCASGEEAYTLAMVFAEALGLDAYKQRVKIYATDVDDDALLQARQSIYTPRQIESVPEKLVAKYFERVNGNYTFVKDLRRTVIFGRHDLIQDAPISRVDLLACRNALMYFNSDAQAKIIARFYFALREGGYLVLGKAELLFNQTALFTPLDLKRRIFRATPKLTQRERLLLLAQAGREEVIVAEAEAPQIQIGQAAFETDTMPQVVIDAGGTLLLANDQVRRQFGVSAKDVGRPFRDLELSYRPVELRSCIEQAAAERNVVTIKDVERVTATDGARFYDVSVIPLLDRAGTLLGAKITFSDVSRYKSLQKELQHSKQELETAYEELQSTNEELETTNEELQSTVEELETTNEELQSTNEELETMNEELQSTNEELQTMNEEMRTRSSEVSEVNSFLGAILASLRAAVVVVDQHLQVQAWNVRAEDLWGLRENEVKGKHLLALDIGLPVQDLKTPVRKTLAGTAESETVTVMATNRRGRHISCRVTSSPLVTSDGQVHGAILVMEEEPSQHETEPARTH